MSCDGDAWKGVPKTALFHRAELQGLVLKGRKEQCFPKDLINYRTEAPVYSQDVHRRKTAMEPGSEMRWNAFSSHSLRSFVQHSRCLAWREPTGSAGGKNHGREGTWVISNMILNPTSNELEAAGLQHGQWELAGWHCWGGRHGCVLRWTSEGGELNLFWPQCLPTASDQAQRKMSSGGFPKRYLWRADPCPQGENALQADGQDQADSYCDQGNDGEVLNAGERTDVHPAHVQHHWQIPHYSYSPGKEVLWGTENWHIDAGAADSLCGKGTYLSTSWMVMRAAWMAPGKQRAWQQCL